jgi:hypothetical protein
MAEPVPTPDLKIYKDNCHCGAFKFNFKIPACARIFYTDHIR